MVSYAGEILTRDNPLGRGDGSVTIIALLFLRNRWKH